MQHKNNTELKNTDSLIFDLDGTLWDASGSCSKAWNETLAQLGYKNRIVEQSTVRSLAGLKIEDIFDRHFHFIPKNEHAQLLNCYNANQKIFLKKFGGELYPQVRETLSELRKHYQLFVVSNCLAGYIEGFIKFHSLEGFFTDFECPGNTGLSKSENIRLIVERNQLKHPVYIGDTIWDYEAAVKAGVPFIYAVYGFGKVENAQLKIEKFSDLKNMFLPSVAM